MSQLLQRGAIVRDTLIILQERLSVLIVLRKITNSFILWNFFMTLSAPLQMYFTAAACSSGIKKNLVQHWNVLDDWTIATQFLCEPFEDAVVQIP